MDAERGKNAHTRMRWAFLLRNWLELLDDTGDEFQLHPFLHLMVNTAVCDIVGITERAGGQFGDKAIEVSENFGHSVRVTHRGCCDRIIVQQCFWLLAGARYGDHSFILDLSTSKNAVLRRWIDDLELLRSRAI